MSRPGTSSGGPGPGRLTGLDAARGLAIIGMIIINVGPTTATSPWHRLYLLPYGRASVLFVVIAGIGIGLLAARTARDASSRAGARSVVLWRAAVLAAGGLALQSLTDDIGVILPLYAILFLLAPVPARLSTPGLVGITAVMLVVGPVLVVVHDLLALPPVPGTAPVQVDDPPLDLLLGLLVAGRYPLVTWVVPFLVGLLLARADLTARRTQRRLMVWGTVAALGGLGASTVSRTLLGPVADDGPARLLTGVAHGQMPLWLISSVGGAAALVGLVVRVGQSRPRLVEPLAAYGRLSLTVYVLHILVLVVLVPGELTFRQGMAVSAALVLCSALVPLLWARVGGPGPLERLTRPPWLADRASRRRRLRVPPSPADPR
ncbi:DUF418 domain-containing protein [Jannaschia sp. R86511]|uniref:DUF418 domain-containing protein n=1 Tax=Jannaschia sp. R86511 TaxID=3093853 RepID=UPI0036D41050